MKPRILITYATAFGSTEEIATEIGKTLVENGFAVELRPIVDNPPLEGYAAVLIGSAVQHGHWLPEAVEYVKANQAALKQLPVVLFTVHIQNLGKDETSLQNRRAYLDEVRSLVLPMEEVYFAGRFHRHAAQLLLPLWIARFVPTIDLRNWKKITAWANEFAIKLQAA